jgi:hypothetical protein
VKPTPWRAGWIGTGCQPAADVAVPGVPDAAVTGISEAAAEDTDGVAGTLLDPAAPGVGLDWVEEIGEAQAVTASITRARNRFMAPRRHLLDQLARTRSAAAAAAAGR